MNVMSDLVFDDDGVIFEYMNRGVFKLFIYFFDDLVVKVDWLMEGEVVVDFDLSIVDEFFVCDCFEDDEEDFNVFLVVIWDCG